MQRSLASMQGLPLLTAAGVRMGEVTDAYFEPYEQRVLALAVEWEENEAAVLGPEDLLPMTQLLELNADIGTIADEIGATAGLEADDQVAGDGWIKVFEQMLEKPVVDGAGRAIGKLADLHFDPQDGSVLFYEIVEDDQADPLMLPPARGMELRDGQLVVDAASIENARKHNRPAQLGIAFLEDEGFEDQVGEDDLEVIRTTGAQPD